VRQCLRVSSGDAAHVRLLSADLVDVLPSEVLLHLLALVLAEQLTRGAEREARGRRRGGAESRGSAVGRGNRRLRRLRRSTEAAAAAAVAVLLTW
jgi:hypothetical protein